jgi:hypothetical protein
MFGRRARLPMSQLLNNNDQDPPIFGQKLQDQADTSQWVKAQHWASRGYNRKRLNKRATNGIIQIGDTVVLQANEHVTLTYNMLCYCGRQRHFKKIWIDRCTDQQNVGQEGQQLGYQNAGQDKTGQQQNADEDPGQYVNVFHAFNM